METSGPTSGISQLLAATTRTGTGQWQVGQLLQAVVTQSDAGKVLLAIGNRQVSAQTSLPLQKGEQLTLQVRSMGEQPVLRIAHSLGESPAAMAVRMLLPRHGPTTPALANMVRISQAPQAPLPPLVSEMTRTLVRNLPDAQGVSNLQGLKRAVQDSGLFLENRLAQSAREPATSVTFNSDYKANLLRLVQVVRNWPGSTATQPPAQPGSKPPAPANIPVTARPATSPLPVPPTTVGTATTLQVPLAGAGTGAVTTATPPPAGAPPAAQPAAGTASQTPPPASPDQVQRAVQAATGQKPGPAQTPTAATTPAATLPGTAAAPAPATGPVVASNPLPAPPFRGNIPLPQAAQQASLDFLNRLGNLRTDLLQQTEAALARLQLHQLATLPREGERGLVEWMFELPVRRGDEIDLWSLRWFRETPDQEKDRTRQQPQWSVQLAFDLPGLGPLQALVQLSGEQVSTRFWAAQEQTLPLLRENMNELRQALNGAGLEVGDLECHPGSMPTGDPGKQPPMINEKA